MLIAGLGSGLSFITTQPCRLSVSSPCLLTCMFLRVQALDTWVLLWPPLFLCGCSLLHYLSTLCISRWAGVGKYCALADFWRTCNNVTPAGVPLDKMWALYTWQHAASIAKTIVAMSIIISSCTFHLKAHCVWPNYCFARQALHIYGLCYALNVGEQHCAMLLSLFHMTAMSCTTPSNSFCTKACTRIV